MFCPNCRTEYVGGVTTCADCDVPLVEQLPPEPAETVEVWAGSESDELLYDFLCDALVNSGIEFHSRRSQSSHLFPVAFETVPPLTIRVHRDQAGRARDLIQECLQSFDGEPSSEGTPETEPS